MKHLSLAIVALIVVFCGPAQAQAAGVTAKGFVNGYDIDSHTDTATAIRITDQRVTFIGRVENGTDQPIVIQTVTATLPALSALNQTFVANETVPAGKTKSTEVAFDIPGWVLTLKGYYSVEVALLDQQGAAIMVKRFMVFLGEGSPLTGIPGAAGTAAAAVAVASGVGAVVAGSRKPKVPEPADENVEHADKPKRGGGGLGALSAVAMFFAVLFLMFALGIGVSNDTALFWLVGGGLSAGIADSVLIRILQVAIRARA